LRTRNENVNFGLAAGKNGAMNNRCIAPGNM